VAALKTWLLLGGEDLQWLARLLADPNARLRGAAAQVAGEELARRSPAEQESASARALIDAMLGRCDEPDVAAAMQLGLALGSIASESNREPALRRLAERHEDRWVRLAIASSSRSTVFAASLRFVPSASGPMRPVPRPAVSTVSRSTVLESYRPALTLTGQPGRGAAIVSRLCLGCHSLLGQGQRVGPDLAGANARSPETLLQDILDPNRQIAPDYAAYEIIPKTGDSAVGLIASETAQRLTLRHPGAPDSSWARSEIREIRATGRSLMPEGLEESLNHQDVADLLAFLRAPSADLLPKQP
jgi:putative heme-binding domain-containing protein